MPELMITANIHRVYISAPGTVLSSSHALSFNPHIISVKWTLLLVPRKSRRNWGVEESRNLPDTTRLGSGRTGLEPISLAPEPLFWTTMQNIFPPCSLYLLCKLCCINITDYNREDVSTLICVVTLYCTQTVYCFFCPNEWKLIS